MPKIYDGNNTAIDWIRKGEFLNDTLVENAYRVTPPDRSLSTDFALQISTLAGETVILQHSPDKLDTALADLVPADMEWLDLPESTFTERTWKNTEAPEGWLRIKVVDSTGGSDFQVTSRANASRIRS